MTAPPPVIAAPPVAPDVPARFDRRPSMLAVGVTVWLASELMFFAGLFASYFTIRAADSNWPGPDAKLSTLRDLGFTLLLVASSFTMQWAVHLLAAARRRSAIRWVVATLVLGTLFLANQVLEWGQVPFRPSTSAFGSLFFIMTGFHGLHVLFGLLAMMGLLVRLHGDGHDPGSEPVAEVITYYWHFVDVVWLGLFATLFFIH